MNISEEERFWSKVDKTPGQGPKGECWTWTKSRMSKGYGVFWRDNPERTELAHRVAWEFLHGPVPELLKVLHECDNPPCVRCLFLGTQGDNMDDMARKSRSISREQEIEIGKRYRTGETQRTIAKDFNVSASTIGKIARSYSVAQPGEICSKCNQVIK